MAIAGRKKEEFSPLPLSYSDMRPGCYDSVARLADMDQARILASLCFPSFPRLCGQTFHEGKDKELGQLCVRAYNDFMIDEWCGNAPGRYIPLIIVPLWDPQLAAAEIRRCAERGAKAVSFSENPAPLGLPSLHHDRGRYWDPVFDAASECGLPLCTHFGSSSSPVKTSHETPIIATIAMNPTSLLLSTIDWLFSGILPRFPGLKICLSEGGLGCIPWVLQRSDYTLDRQRDWAASGELEGDMLSGVSTKESSSTETVDYSIPPSQLFRDHIFGCFIDEPDAVPLIEQIGVDNVMAETDYPHTDSSWPNSGDLISQQLAGPPQRTGAKLCEAMPSGCSTSGRRRFRPPRRRLDLAMAAPLTRARGVVPRQRAGTWSSSTTRTSGDPAFFVVVTAVATAC